MPKYKFVNGVMQLDPTYQAQNPSTAQAMPIISSPTDVFEASSTQGAVQPVMLTPATAQVLNTMQDPEYLKKFQAAPGRIDGGVLVDKLTEVFSRYEIPIGLLNKLYALSDYKLNFLIDDSGTMNNNSDASLHDATYLLKHRVSQLGHRYNNLLTRWEEAEDRLHIMIDMLAFIPTDTITINFLNRPTRYMLVRAGKTPEEFADYAHRTIFQEFSIKPVGVTPTYHKLKEAFDLTVTNTMHYLLTDGEPSDASTEQVAHLIKTRRNPKMTPLTFISCTNEDASWMKEVDNEAPFTAEVDDFLAEKKEVLENQGPGLPYTRGLWLLCQLTGAINPDDLDPIDEKIPFTRGTICDLMGYQVSEQQYAQQYFDKHPLAAKYKPVYASFARVDLIASKIVNTGTGEILATQPPPPAVILPRMGETVVPSPIVPPAQPVPAPYAGTNPAPSMPGPYANPGLYTSQQAVAYQVYQPAGYSNPVAQQLPPYAAAPGSYHPVSGYGSVTQSGVFAKPAATQPAYQPGSVAPGYRN